MKFSPRNDMNDVSVRRSSSFSNSQTKLSISMLKPLKSREIPKFHFPYGESKNEATDLENQIEKIYRIFPQFGGGNLEHVEQFCEVANLPKNWRKLICFAAARGSLL